MRTPAHLTRIGGVALAAIVALVGMSAVAAAETVEVKIATLAPRGSTWMKVLSRGAAEVEKQTSGRVKFKYYPNGVQGDERDVVRKMRLGQLDGAAVTSVGLSLIDESIRVLEIPRLFNTVDEMEYVRNKMWGYFRNKFTKKGFYLAEPGEVGWVYFFSQTPIKAIGDLRSAKTWKWTDDEISRAMFKQLNVNGVPLGVPDVLPSLTSGRINACYGSPLAAVALQWNTKIKYMTSMPMSYSIGATVVRKEVWEKMSDSDRKIVQKIFRKQANKLKRAVRNDNKTAQKQMTRKGVKVVDTPAAMIREFDNAAQAVWKKLAGKTYSQKELDQVLAHRQAFRAK